MNIFSFLSLCIVLSIVGMLLYWHVLEKKRSRADATQSHHPPLLQRVIRWLPILAGLFLIFQLLGSAQLGLPIPSGLKQTLFIVGLVLFWLAAAIAIWARQTLGRDWAHAADFQIIPGQALVTTGPYAYIRHPIYAAFLLMFVGIELVVASWLIVLALPLYWFLVWQSKKEEELLTQTFGQAYRDYAKRTGMLFPFVFGK